MGQLRCMSGSHDKLTYVNTYARIKGCKNYANITGTCATAGILAASSGGNGDKLRLQMIFEPYQDFYPRYMWELGTPYYLGELDSEATFDSIKYLARSDQSYAV